MNPMLDLSLIDRDLTEQSAQELQTTDERLAKVMGLSAADRFAEAAEAAQALFEVGTYDLRVTGPFLFGVYLEKGMEVIPEILGVLVRILSSSYAVWGPQPKKQIHADNMLKWLLSTILRDFRMHETGQDDIWKQWNSGSEFTIAERQGLKLIPELQERMVHQLGNAKALPYLLQLESMLRKMEISAQSTRPRIGKGRDDLLSVKLGGIEPPPSSEEGSSASAGESSDEERSEDDSSSHSQSASSSGSSSPSSESSPSSSSSPADTDSESSSSSSTGSSSQSEDSEAASQSSSVSSASSQAESAASDEPNEEEAEQRAQNEAAAKAEREREEAAAKAAEVAAIQAEESAAEAEPAAKGARTISIAENEPFRQLRRKLAAFQKLVSSGDHERAAIVAQDLLHTLDHFDPRLYLPTMFRKFFRVLSLVGNDLTPHMTERTDLSYKAMLQLYQVDLDYFVRGSTGKRK
jgi:chemotaxis protein histidine kinase CheA